MEIRIRFGNPDDTIRIAGVIGNMKQDIDIATDSTERKKWSTVKNRNHVAKRFSRTDTYFYLVADTGKDIIGVIEARFITKKRLYLAKGFVEPSFRRQGVMKRLEDQLVCVAKNRGVKEIELSVIESNIPAVKTWTSLGYKTAKVIVRKGYQSLLMKKVIDTGK